MFVQHDAVDDQYEGYRVESRVLRNMSLGLNSLSVFQVY
jgi:hypothetical protein